MKKYKYQRLTKEEKKQSKNVHEITIKIEGEEWKKALDKAFNDKKRDTVVDLSLIHI